MIFTSRIDQERDQLVIVCTGCDEEAARIVLELLLDIDQQTFIDQFVREMIEGHACGQGG
jgi:hypothetical protein